MINGSIRARHAHPAVLGVPPESLTAMLREYSVRQADQTERHDSRDTHPTVNSGTTSSVLQTVTVGI